MIDTTLCYIEKDDAYLMMHRIKKEIDVNKDKWVGVGGKFLPGETPDECLLREAREEAGVTLTDFHLRGKVTFLSDKWEGEYMYLYTATAWDGEISYDCNEGTLEFVAKSKVYDLPIWEGDKLFFRELEKDSGYFEMLLRYEGDTLVESSIEYPTEK